MITMGGFSLPSKTIREMIVSSVDVIIQAGAPARRLAPHHPHHRGDGAWKATSIITQDIMFVYELIGEDATGQA